MTDHGKRHGRVRPTIGSAFDPRRNSLNFLRVALAVAVIVSHAWPVGGFGPDPRYGGYGVGHWAVAGFFALSGFLVTGSRMQLGLAGYLLRRAVRILPGFWACLAVTAFVAAPISAWLSDGRYRFPSALLYAVENAGLVIVRPGIDDTLLDVPHAHVWDESLWTLKWEFLAYVAVGALLSVPAFRTRPSFVLAGFAGLTALHAVLLLTNTGADFVLQILWLSKAFAAGVVLYFYADRIPHHAGLAAGAVVALVVSGLTGTVTVFGALPLAYLLMWSAIALPLHRAFRRDDISYGLYIYAFVVQQCLALTGVQRVGVVWFAAIGIAATVPLAAASWFLVEKPAKAIVGMVERRRPPAPAHHATPAEPARR